MLQIIFRSQNFASKTANYILPKKHIKKAVLVTKNSLKTVNM